MNDRELLKAAAKAAGYPAGRHVAMDGLLMANDLYWNPLTDDGDALRLAVKLRINVYLDGSTVETESADGHYTEANSTGPEAATRRAITRAAAETGKSMETK